MFDIALRGIIGLIFLHHHPHSIPSRVRIGGYFKYVGLYLMRRPIKKSKKSTTSINVGDARDLYVKKHLDVCCR